MEDMRCVYFDGCPICGSSERVKLLWILAYCKTQRFAQCARHKTRETGQTVEFTLLPDGTHMPPEIEKMVRAYVEECKQAEGRG